VDNFFEIANKLKKGSSGEGTRGGRVIGHTSSGKPIYQGHSNEGHGDFKAQDHKDASAMHGEIVERTRETIQAKMKADPKFQVPEKVIEFIQHHDKQMKVHNSKGNRKGDIEARNKKQVSDVLRNQALGIKKSMDTPFYVGLVVVNPLGEILLGKRLEDGIWTGPGGGADPLESPSQAAIREAYEEANLHLKESQLIELPTHITKNGKICHCFLVFTVQDSDSIHPKNDPDNEVKKWDWYKMDKLPKEVSKDRDRMTTINSARMKLMGLKKSESITHKYQKDWIVADWEKGNLFCLALASNDNKEWSLLEWVNFRDLSDDEMYEMVSLGYDTMLDAAMNTQYGYIIAPHEFDKEAMDKSEYIQELMGNDKNFNDKASFKVGELPIDYSKFVGEVDKLVKKTNFEENMKKSEIAMNGEHGNPSVNTEDFAIENTASQTSPWQSIIADRMQEYCYGTDPVDFDLDGKHTLSLVKVDDGLYSGFIKRDGEDELPETVLTLEKQSIESSGEADLQGKIELLEKELVLCSLKVEGLETLIDLAEAELAISIRKKSGSKQSKK